MSSERRRILFVTRSFRQGGAERFLFEICKALDRERFDLAILTRRSLSPSEYYFGALQDLGIPIHMHLGRAWNPHGILPARRQRKRWSVFFAQLYALRHRRLHDYLRGFDRIVVIQIESYLLLQNCLRHCPNTTVHLMSHLAQYDYIPYNHCKVAHGHSFVLMEPQQKSELSDTELSGAPTFEFPLVLDLQGTKSVYRIPKATEPSRIGVFTRLSTEKPIEALFRALEQLVKSREVILHVYGAGNPKIYARTLADLGISSRIVFEGHAKDLQNVVDKAGLSLVWNLSIRSFIGYASIELAALGVPMLFWSLEDVETDAVARSTDGALQVFSDVDAFVRKNVELLSKTARLKVLGDRLRRHVLRAHEISSQIHKLEEYYYAISPSAGNARKMTQGNA